MNRDMNDRVEAGWARAQAVDVLDDLRDLCARIELAGSLRRGKAYVKDVEIVALPSHKPTLLARLDTWVATGKVAKAVYPDGSHRWGEKYRGFVYGGIRFELFTADADNWGYILWLRTGPGDANQYVMQQLIAQQAPYRPSEGYWQADGQRIRTAEEADVFALLNMPVLAPEQRTLDAYAKALMPPHWWAQEWTAVEVEAAPTQQGMF